MNLLVTLFQFKVVHSKQGDYCVNQLGVLQLEARWLHVMIALTLVKTIIFSCWQQLSYNWSPEEYGMSRDSYSDSLTPEFQSNVAQFSNSQLSSESNQKRSRRQYPHIYNNQDAEVDIEAFSAEASALLKHERRQKKLPASPYYAHRELQKNKRDRKEKRADIMADRHVKKLEKTLHQWIDGRYIIDMPDLLVEQQLSARDE